MFNSFFPQLWLFYLFILIFLRTFAPNKIKTFMNSKKRYMVIALLALLVVSAMAYNDEAKPWTFWNWKYGSVSRPGIHADLTGMKNVDMGGIWLLPVAGKPILMRTIERFHEYDPALNIILVLPENQQAYWHQLCEEHHFSIKHQIANGGDTRFQSSKNGLALIPDDEDGVVGIHDGVRPFVSKEVIEECFETAREEYAAIPVYAVTDTLRYIDQHGGGKNVLRSDYRVVQTPQTFDIGLAKQAFNQEYKEQFTDDASVVESLGCQVAMVEGNRENIKITTPFDIKVAEALLG